MVKIQKFKEYFQKAPTDINEEFDNLLNSDDVIEEGVYDKSIFKAVVLQGPPGCFHGNTEILMCDSTLKKILDIEIDDVVYPNNKVLETFEYQATKKLIEVYFDDGYSVICTDDHKFLIDGNWVEAKNLLNNTHPSQPQ